MHAVTSNEANIPHIFRFFKFAVHLMRFVLNQREMFYQVGIGEHERLFFLVENKTKITLDRIYT